MWITNCQSINFLAPYTHQEINTDPVDLDKFRFVQPLDIANICHDRHNQRLCTFFEPVPSLHTEREMLAYFGQFGLICCEFTHFLVHLGTLKLLCQKLLHSGRTRSQPTTSIERSMVCLISNSTTSSMLSHRFVFFGVKNNSFCVNASSDANSVSITSHIHLIWHIHIAIAKLTYTMLPFWHADHTIFCFL